MNSIYLRPKDYDLQYEDYHRDLPFWVELARLYADGLPVGEFACGTLRVTIPLAEAGHSMIGVDLSREMLDLAHQKVAKLDEAVRGKVNLFEGDMCTFGLHRDNRFNLIIIPFTAFLHLTTAEKQLEALKNMHRQLNRGGRLMVDIFNPHLGRLALGTTPHAPILEKQIQVSSGQETLVRSVSSRYDTASQTLIWTFFVSLYEAVTGDLIRSYREEANVRVIFPNEWRLLLLTAGFEIEREWGDFGFQPFESTSPRMLFLAKKP